MGLSRQLARNVAVEYRLLVKNNTAEATVATARAGEASSQRVPARLGACSATAASSASTTTRSGKYRRVWANSSAVNGDERIRKIGTWQATA
ncbi:Uncharacterised protein [Mycobacterium tuberculosis]|uniref:Uncharacterized protein n=1 Tax=Mycobacterium tuberculosis TaxID=1773 RepID=A0A654U513_MYCTX|nr:Uncharacterised protein [Mycobacterium tuberculosis]CKS58512.1 Uncharacterised protein [Mycobacterium tuberculosis]CNT92379.1 Uncharacterised protein [Mycobacterium tuberculosis]